MKMLLKRIVKFVVLEYPEKIVFYFFENIFKFFPLQNKIVFDNFIGRGYGDDPKYIASYLLKSNSHIRCYWVIKSFNTKLPERIVPIKYKSIRYLYHMCTAKVWIDNVKNCYKPSKRRGQFYIQTWHASVSLKAVEEKVSTLLPIYVKESKMDSSKIDLMYANNNLQYNIYKNCFWYKGKVLKCDVPREVPILDKNNDFKKKVKSLYGIADECLIVMYAPTFRKNCNIDIYKWDYERILKTLEKKFNNKFVLLLRLHPAIVRFASNFDYSDKVINASEYPDMQELLGSTDVLINDYSSSMFDFCLTNNPVFLYVPDIYSYKKQDRTLEIEIEQLPFSTALSIENLESNILNFDKISYLNKLHKFKESIGFKDEGCGDKIISDIIIKHIYPNEV